MVIYSCGAGGGGGVRNPENLERHMYVATSFHKGLTNSTEKNQTQRPPQVPMFRIYAAVAVPELFLFADYSF